MGLLSDQSTKKRMEFKVELAKKYNELEKGQKLVQKADQLR